MAVHEIRLDFSKPLFKEPHLGHNRWHPEIPPVLRIEPGDEVVIDARDGVDLELSGASTAEDVAALNLNRTHPLTGPVHVEGAEPGDLLEVEILEVIAFEFGFTAQWHNVGFLRDLFPWPHMTRWQVTPEYATSPELPGVRVPVDPFFGILGVAPSHELLRRAAARERDLVERGGFALPPLPADAVPADGNVPAEGLRTIPPRENGGNIDIRQLTAGARVLLPVHVSGALFSAGDAHAAQGDGEVCGTAIETSGTLRARFGLRKGEATERGVRTVQFERPPTGRPERPYFVTTGIPVDADGRNHGEDLTMAARDALLTMIRHLKAEYGFTDQQAYTVCSVAVDLRASQIVDVPNFIVSAFLPLDIFE